MAKNGRINMNQDEHTLQIGQIAQFLDAEYSILERMKLKKETLKRLGYAIALYISTMITFMIIL